MRPEDRAAQIRAERAHGENALRAARALVALGLYNDAVSRAYYAAFHLARCILLSDGVETKTHGAVISMIGLHFVSSGRLPAERAKDLGRLQQFRALADYDPFFVFTKEGAEEELAAAGRFTSAAIALLDAPDAPP